MSGFNGSGQFLISGVGLPYVTGAIISSSVGNTLNNDIATGLSSCITKDGQQVITADIPFNNHKITGLASGVGATDAANIGNIQVNSGQLLTVTGTNTLAAVASPTLTAYTAGSTFRFFAAGANTGAVTLNISTLGAKDVLTSTGAALVANDIPAAGYLVTVVYNGTAFLLQNENRFTNLTAVNFIANDIATDTIKETATISATASTGTINYNLDDSQVLFYTVSATGNWTLNFRYNATTSLNSAMSIGQSMTAAFMAQQSNPAYYNSAVQIDGAAVTVKWQNALAVSAGNVNSVDVYCFTIIKTANATFTVLASQTQFA